MGIGEAEEGADRRRIGNATVELVVDIRDIDHGHTHPLLLSQRNQWGQRRRERCMGDQDVVCTVGRIYQMGRCGCVDGEWDTKRIGADNGVAGGRRGRVAKIQLTGAGWAELHVGDAHRSGWIGQIQYFQRRRGEPAALEMPIPCPRRGDDQTIVHGAQRACSCQPEVVHHDHARTGVTLGNTDHVVARQ